MLGYHHDSLDRESSIAVIEKVFKRRSKKVDDENIVQTLLAKIVYVRYSGWLWLADRVILVFEQLTASHEYLICPVLIPQLWCIALSGFLITASADRNSFRGQ